MAPAKLKLPSSVYSPDQLLFCAEELADYAENLKQAERRKSKTLDPISDDSQDLLQLLPAASRTNAVAIRGLVAQLQSTAATAPVVTLTLAGLPGAALKQQLSEWFRQKVSPYVLVAFHVNRDIAGGVVVRTTNHVWDFSWRKQLLKQPEQFTKILERL